MEAVVERENLKKALAQVKRNKGAAGVDGMTVGELAAYLKEHWPTIRGQLLDGTYKPQPVRRVEIPKPSGGMRPLGIPTVLDRFIQQAAMQVRQANWDAIASSCGRIPHSRLLLGKHLGKPLRRKFTAPSYCSSSR
jgi:RNA-directed DNA polymerase